MGDKLLALVYRLMPIRLYQRAASIAATLDSGVVCDVGGGAGNFARALERLGYMPGFYVVVDPDTLLLSRAPRLPWVERVAAVAEALPFRNSSCGLAVLYDALHHFPEPQEALGEVLRAARCILVEDIEPERLLGRVIALLERLAGYPAAFTGSGELLSALESMGYRVTVRERGGVLPVYRLLACRPVGVD